MSDDAPSPEPHDDTAQIVGRLGVYAVPVAVIHVAIVYQLFKAATGFSFPRFVPTGLLITWLWVNGGLIALAACAWRTKRFVIDGRLRFRGRHARWAAVLWVVMSFGWFAFPALTTAALAELRALVSGW